MPTVTLNKAVFEKLVGKKLPIDKLKDRISMLGTDLGRIDEKEIEVEIFPNRPDMLSEQGFARAFSSFIGAKTGLRKYDIKKSGYKLLVEKSLPKEWPYALACVVKGIKFDDEKIREVIQIQEKLGTTLLRKRKKGGLGLYPLEKIEFPVRFVGMEPDEINFRPLEYPSVITGRQILSKHPTGREYAHICQDWRKFPVFVDSKETIMSMPPIINSHTVGKIDETTRDVFLEITGNDMYVLQHAFNIMATSLADMGGQIYSIDCIQQDGSKLSVPNLAPREMKIDISYANKLLGTEFTEKEIKKYLERMGYGYKNKKVYVPCYRVDVLHQIDLVEDIAIAYGYENFNGKLPDFFTVGEEAPFEVFKNKISNILVGLGLLECFTYHLSNKKIQCEKANCSIDLIEVRDTKTEDNCLRAWLIPCLLKVLMENKHNEYPQNIFDIGTIFKRGNSETGIVENDRLAVLLCNEKSDYTKIRQVLDYLFAQLDLKYKVEEADHGAFIGGRVGRIMSDNAKVGYIGEISPEVLSNFALELPVAALELNLTELFETMNKNVRIFHPVSDW